MSTKTEAAYAKPLPRIAADNEPFFDGLKAGEVAGAAVLTM